MARLLVTGGGTGGSTVELGTFVSIGRDPSCTLCVSDPAVAEAQAEIHRMSDGDYKILDVGQAPATLVNGQPVASAVLIDGDEITIGELALRYEAPPEAAETWDETSYEFDDISVQVSLRQDATKEPAFEAMGAAGDAEVQRELSRLQAAYDLTRALGLEQDVDTVLDRVLETAFTLFHADRGGIFLLDPQTGELANPKARARSSEAGRIRFSRSVIRHAVDEREALISLDAATDHRFETAQSVRLGGVHSIMCVPMLWIEEVVGIIYLDSQIQSGLFDNRDLQLLTTFARQAAMAIKNAHLLTELQRTNDELRRSNEELEKLVVRDPLTRLYNHAYLQELLEQEIRRSERYDLSFGLLLIDIDDFRRVNDDFGHMVGNRLLCYLADTFRLGRRKSDVGARYGDQPVATRFEKDIFAVLLPETSKRGAAVTAERLREQIANHNFAEGGIPQITISIGVASCPVDAHERPDLIQAAEVALRAAKQAGGNQTVSYTRSLAPREDRIHDAEMARIVGLERVIQNAAMDYVYQPIVQAEDGKIIGYEALCRPREAAFASPVELLTTAERTGRIGELGTIMRRVATIPLDRLPEPLVMFVNLHPLELTDALLRWGEQFPAPQRLVLEVTESAEITEHRRTCALLAALKKQGFRIALDDLGAGYSGLNSLALLEPDFVKLDMRMVQNIDSDSRQARLVKYILDFAAGEGMTVIAEGIETVGEREVMIELGCHYLQGYYFARPQPPFCEVQIGS